MLKKTKILKLSVAPPARDVEDAADAAQHKQSDREMLLCWDTIKKKGRFSSCLGHNGRFEAKKYRMNAKFP